MTIRAHRPGWTAAKLIALTSLIAASCALPAYEIGNAQTASASGSASGAGGAGSTSSTGGSGGEASTGQGGSPVDAGPDATVDGCPATEPEHGSPCGVPPGGVCTYKRACCSVGVTCESNKWNVPQECPGGCPEFPPPPGCNCTTMPLAEPCFYDQDCKNNPGGSVTILACKDGASDFAQKSLGCCSANADCKDMSAVCIHVEAKKGTFSVCKPNECAGNPSCDCVNQTDMCFIDYFTCKTVDQTGVTCIPK